MQGARHTTVTPNHQGVCTGQLWTTGVGDGCVAGEVGKPRGDGAPPRALQYHCWGPPPPVVWIPAAPRLLTPTLPSLPDVSSGRCATTLACPVVARLPPPRINAAVVGASDPRKRSIDPLLLLEGRANRTIDALALPMVPIFLALQDVQCLHGPLQNAASAPTTGASATRTPVQSFAGPPSSACGVESTTSHFSIVFPFQFRCW